MTDQLLGCALRALSLCDGQDLLNPGDGLACYCDGISHAAITGQWGVAQHLRWARAVEVARAQRDPDYVQRMQRQARLEGYSREF